MNWGQFKDSVCYLCLAGIGVASWFLAQEFSGLKISFLNMVFLVTEFAEFSENILGKLNCPFKWNRATLLPPTNEVREGNVFTLVCLFTGRGYDATSCLVPCSFQGVSLWRK